jgi:hypothetical protein
VTGERVEGVGHMAVAEVPGGDPPAEHRAVVGLRVLHGPRVLLRVEQLVLGDEPVAPCVLQGVALQVDELLDRLPLAGLVRPEAANP